MKKISILILLIFLSSCGERSSIEKAVKDSMIDPDSAKFGEFIEFVGHNGEEKVCVMVNGKNSYGGYAGETAFIAYKNDTGKWEAVQFSTSVQVDCSSYIEVNKLKTR